MEGKVDPRIIRTKQLIQDAFNSLLLEKDFKSITVRDITEKATINRATFYAHFTDKYELLDQTISANFHQNLKPRLDCHQLFNKDSIKNILITMCDYQKNLTTLCSSRYQSLESVIQNIIIDELQSIIHHLILKSVQDEPLLAKSESIKIMATMLSWSIYGASYSWNKEGRIISAEDFTDKALPFLLEGTKIFYGDTTLTKISGE